MSLILEFEPSKKNIGKNFNFFPLSFLFHLPFCCGLGVCGEAAAGHKGWGASACLGWECQAGLQGRPGCLSWSGQRKGHSEHLSVALIEVLGE